MKLITRDTDYAVKALAAIAESKTDIVSVGDLSGKLKIPRPFLRKILQILNKKGILKSIKGKSGGFILAVAPRDIFLFRLMEIFQGKFQLNECLFKKHLCPNRAVCPLRKKILKIESYVAKELGSVTLGSLFK